MGQQEYLIVSILLCTLSINVVESGNFKNMCGLMFLFRGLWMDPRSACYG